MADKVGTLIDGKYKLISLIGEGGMGTVYEAKHTLIGRSLAVKFLLPQYATVDEVVKRFHREARSAAAIGHDHIIEITDMGTTPEGEPYIVMEYLDGQDLKEVLEQESTISENRAAYIMVQALSALHAAHEVGIVHRDLKPDNVFLITKSEIRDFVKVLDFGVSKFQSLDNTDGKGLTQTGTVLGTPSYMSPEQARGTMDITRQADVYAMGVILYRMLTGELPYDGKNYNSLLIKIITEDPIPAEKRRVDLTPGMAAIIHKAMHKDLKQRYSDCIAMREDLMLFAPEAGAVLGASLGTGVHDVEALREHYQRETTTVGMVGAKVPRKTTRVGFALLFLLVAGLGFGVVKMNYTDLSHWQSYVPEGIQELLPPWFTAAVGFEQPAPSARGPQLPLVVADTDMATVDTDTVDTAAIADTDTAADTDSSTDSATSSDAKTVELKISVLPQTAVISIDGVVVEGNPFVGRFPSDGAMRKISATAEGYIEKADLVPFTSSMELVIELEKLPAKKKVRRRRKKSSRRKKASTRTKSKRRGIDDADPWN